METERFLVTNGHSPLLPASSLLSTPILRFVILHHENSRGAHWDLMFENGESLTTWAVPPQTPGHAFDCRAERLPDHRLAYLDYEGPVSHNRGFVRRIDAGNFETTEFGRYRLSGRFLSGLLIVETTDDSCERVHFTPFLTEDQP